ncbi:MAG: PEP-CTERM sorting domain-containing protein [Lentisphaerae bacterium]|nr:PEP-CTERM sorting domain-containing protein [Lentisphaerota bacterium]
MVESIKRLGAGLAAAVLATAVPASAQVTTYGWAGTVDTDWSNTGNWRPNTAPGVGGTNFACIFITNGTGNALYYTAALGDGYYANTNGTTGSGRVLRIADNGTTGALYITGGTLETRGSGNGDMIGNGANSFGMIVVDGGRYVSSTNSTMLFGNTGARAVLTINSGTGLVGTIQAANSTVGEINLNGGLFQVNQITRSGSMNLSITFNGATVRAPTAQASWMPAVGTTYTILSGGAILDTAGNNVGLAGALSGVGGLTKNGGGLLTLGGASSYDGVTTINGGSVLVTNNTGLGSANGGTVIASGSHVRLGNGVVVSGETATITGAGDNFGALQAAASSTSVWNGPVLLQSNAGGFSPRIGAAAGGVLTVSGPISNGVSGSNLYIAPNASGGRVVLSGTNAYSGLTGVIRGTLALGRDNSLPSGTALTLNVAALVSESSTFDLAGFSQTVGGFSSVTGHVCLVTNSSTTLGTLTVNQSANTSYNGAIGGNLSLVKGGMGVLTLSNATTHTGPTILNAGGLVVMAENGLGGSAVTVNGGTLALGTTNAIPGTLTFSGGNNTAALGTTYALDQAFIEWAAAKVSGTVPVLVSGGNNANSLSFTGALSGTFLGGVGLATNSGGVSWADSTLRLGGGSGSLRYAAAIGGATNVVIGPVGGNSTSIVELPGGNTHSGTTVINSGTLRVLADSSLGAVPGVATPASITVNGGGMVASTADVQLDARRGVAIGTNGATFGAPNGGVLRIHGVIADLPGEMGRLTAAGAGILVLSNTNTYSGGTIVSPGQELVIQGNRALGFGPVTLAGGTLRPSTGAAANTDVSNAVIIAADSSFSSSAARHTTYLGPVTLSNGTRTVTITGTDTATFAGPIGDGGLGYGFTKAGTSMITLRGTNTFGGATRVAGGTLALAGAGTLTNSPVIQIDTGATLNVSARTGGSMTLVSGQTLKGAGTFTGGLITGSGSTLSPGASPGILTVNGAVTLDAGSTLSVEINGTTAGTQYDRLAFTGGSLTLNGATLDVVLGYAAGLGDSFQIVTGLVGYDPGASGVFAGKADGSTFTVGSTALRIDYNSNAIALTVVPEPASLGVLGLLAAAALLRRRLR